MQLKRVQSNAIKQATAQNVPVHRGDDLKPTAYLFRVHHCSIPERLKQRGFTLVELITVLVLVGILAMAALPRFFDKNTFDSRGYADQVISALRFAQKIAVAQHSFVCVTFVTNSVTLTHGATAACGSPLTSPAGVTPYTVTSPTTDVTLSNFADFNFNALGRPSTPQPGAGIVVSGYATPIVVEAETGYVH